MLAFACDTLLEIDTQIYIKQLNYTYKYYHINVNEKDIIQVEQFDVMPFSECDEDSELRQMKKRNMQKLTFSTRDQRCACWLIILKYLGKIMSIL